MEQKRIKKWVDRIVYEINVNAGRVSQEVRETGELAALLSKAAAGKKLSTEERGKVREQLLDLAKIVPSLAILAAPGGSLILVALLKVLPFNLLPSSFQKSPEELPLPEPLPEAEAEAGAEGGAEAKSEAEAGEAPQADAGEAPGGSEASEAKTGTDEA